MLLFGVRTGVDADPVPRLGRFRTLRLAGVDERAARDLISATMSRPLSEAAVGRLVFEAGGNPLALLELPSLLTPPQLAMWTRGHDPLPIASLLEQAFCGSIRYLGEETTEALPLLATLGRVPPAVLDRALGAAGLDRSAFEPAERTGLLVESDSGPEFRHPLVRSAIYQTSLGSHRRRAHLCAAQILDESGLPNALESRVASGGRRRVG